jgi:hypothetical protein
LRPSVSVDMSKREATEGLKIRHPERNEGPYDGRTVGARIVLAVVLT